MIYLEFFENKTIDSDIYISCLKKMKKEIEEKRGSDSKIRLLHDNAKPHTSKKTKKSIEELRIKIIKHPPYSPDLAPSDYYLFPRLKDNIRGKRFKNKELLEEEVIKWLNNQPKSFFSDGIRKLEERWKLCISNKGEYFEKNKKKRKKKDLN